MRSQAIAFRVDHDRGDDASDLLAFVEQLVAGGDVTEPRSSADLQPEDGFTRLP
jgi:hypothetical protein